MRRRVAVPRGGFGRGRPVAQSPAPESSYAASPHADAVPARDRGSTYLRCCVFLI